MPDNPTDKPTPRSKILAGMVRWAYLLDTHTPYEVSFCELCRRCLIYTPAKIVGLVFIFVALAVLFGFVGGFTLWMIGTAVVVTHIVLIPALAITAVILVIVERVQIARGPAITSVVDRVITVIEAHPVTQNIEKMHRGICPIIDLTEYRR